MPRPRCLDDTRRVPASHQEGGVRHHVRRLVCPAVVRHHGPPGQLLRYAKRPREAHPSRCLVSDWRQPCKPRRRGLSPETHKHRGSAHLDRYRVCCSLEQILDSDPAVSGALPLLAGTLPPDVPSATRSKSQPCIPAAEDTIFEVATVAFSRPDTRASVAGERVGRDAGVRCVVSQRQSASVSFRRAESRWLRAPALRCRRRPHPVRRGPRFPATGRPA